ncbi:EAL domain-containing protein [Hydrogenimonas sp.]
MDLPEKIKKRTLFATFTLIFIVVAFMLLYINDIFEKKMFEEIERKDEILHNLFEQTMEQDTHIYERRLTSILNKPGVKEAFKKRERERLYELVAPHYREMTKENPFIKIMTFRLEDGSAFLRMHKPEVFGDELNKKRRIIVDTNIEKKRHFGFEVGKYEMTYRIVLPIFYKNEYIGLVELGIDPTSFIKKITKVIGLRYALVIRKDMKSVMIEKKEFLDKDDFSLASTDPFFKKVFKKIQLKQKSRNNFIRYGGRYYFVENDLALHDHNGKKTAILLAAEDVTEEFERKKELFYKFLFIFVFPLFFLFLILNYSFNLFIKKIYNLIYDDDLTGLRNRIALRKDLQESRKRALVLIDINSFKTVNELYGIEAGNEVLRQFGAVLESFAQKRGFTGYRISSDEFVLMKPYEKLDPNQCGYFINDLNGTVRKHTFTIPDTGIEVDIEITVGMVFGRRVSLEKALMALEKAREEKKEYLVYSSKINTKKNTMKIISMKYYIKKALQNDDIVVYFQPITDIDSNIVKYEALVRMVKEAEGERRVLTPNEFLELSKKFNLYPEISKRVIEKSLAVFEKRDEKISINLSPTDIMDNDMQKFIIEKLESYPSPERVVFEITENESIRDFEDVKAFIQKVRFCGAQIAIDDFGRGYSNYFHILELKPDYLKIDGSLIKDIHMNRESRIVVKTIAIFAKELGVKTVAEFICCEEVFNVTKEFGIDEFQGFYFGKPTPDIL